jgi:peptidoglycan L-alanyl-D-glutamate endopeptidase CwlK
VEGRDGKEDGMNFRFSKLSEYRLQKVDPVMVKLARLMIKRTPVDFGIAWLGGFRTAEEQNGRFKEGFSSKDGYVKRSKHQDGLALDFLPYINGRPVPKNQKHYLIIIGVAFACADELGIKIRSGSNWDMDGEFITDQEFDDYPHIERIV